MNAGILFGYNYIQRNKKEFHVLKPKIHSWVFSLIKYVPFLPIILQINLSHRYRLASDCAAMLHIMTTNLSFFHVH